MLFAKENHSSLKNIHKRLKNKGRVFIQFRNDLFAMFTFNLYSADFYKKLIPLDLFSPELRERAIDFFNKKLDIPFQNKEINILSKFDNPLNMKGLFNNFEIVNTYFFHFHPLPPIFEKTHFEEFRKVSKQIEQSQNWKGYFMASSFIIEAIKK